MQTVKPDDVILKLLTAFFQDVGNQYPIRRIDTQRDIDYCKNRLINEGISFVTKTLPLFGKHFDNCLQTEVFSPFTSFKKDRTGVLPLILKGLTQRVFDNATGYILSNPDTDAIRLLRQFSFMFYKLEMDYSEETVDAFVRNFKNVDNSLSKCDNLSSDQFGLIYEAQKVVHAIFQDFDPEEIIPRPGPGQTACRTKGWDRFEPHIRFEDLHQAYPYYSYFYHSSYHLLSRVRAFKSLPHKTSGVSRLALVPKDSRGPRIICMEPNEYMWLQQGLGRAIMKHVENHWLTRGHVNFTDQEVNRDLAREGSIHGDLVTLDMKEASDRVSRNLVELLFDDVPRLRDKLLALSTPATKLPSGETIKTKKFAPMGSALCFPIESIVHYALMLASVKLAHRVKVDTARKHCYVYGDDIIIHKKYANAVLEDFPKFDLRFNEGKCCLKGHFRESCGMDAYNGANVTPQKLKNIKLNRKSPSSLARHLAIFHGFYSRGLWSCARYWQQLITHTWGNLPRCTRDSAVLGYEVPRTHILEANKGRWKWDADLQCMTLKAKILKSKPIASAIGGWEQLLKQQVYSHVDSEAFSVRGREKFSWKRLPISAV